MEVFGLINLAVQSKDEIEYTIYYLAESSSTLSTNTIADVKLCDAIPPNTIFIANSSLISRSGAPLTNSGTFRHLFQPPTIHTKSWPMRISY